MTTSPTDQPGDASSAPSPPGELELVARHRRVLRDAADGDRWRWRARIRGNPTALFWYRVAVGVLGALLMIAAGLTGWLPGPGGIPLFLLGLAVWASEFRWAHRPMAWFRLQFHRIQSMTDSQQRVFWTLTVIAILTTWYIALLVAGVPGWMPETIANLLGSLPGVDQ